MLSGVEDRSTEMRFRKEMGRHHAENSVALLIFASPEISQQNEMNARWPTMTRHFCMIRCRSPIG